MHIHYFQHVPFEGLGCIENWANDKAHTLTATRWYDTPAAPDNTPDISSADMLIVMGGPMGVYEEDQYPWLTTEKKLIRDVIAAGKPVLGICLGSQLIAAALGAKVYPNGQQEIGWFPVTFHNDLAPTGSMIFHWHGDTFDLPPNAVHLAETPVCKNQAFRIGDRVFGLQFHLEVTAAAIDGMLANLGHHLPPATPGLSGPTTGDMHNGAATPIAPDAYIQSAADIRAGRYHTAATNTWMYALLNRLEKLV